MYVSSLSLTHTHTHAHTCSMTTAAQQALRRTMEIYSSTTRFALACNVSSKIIEAIQSRCAILRYTRLSDEQLLKRLLEVIKAEKVSTQSCAVFLVGLLTRNPLATHTHTHTHANRISLIPTMVWKLCFLPRRET